MTSIERTHCFSITALGQRRVADTTTFGPAPTSSGNPADATAPTPSRSASRRFLARFALIAFGLFHVPLFLNNYPSLGGGGAPVEDGLAVRWGHVFTVPGIWVARTVLHVAKPNPASFRGDNADYGEEFGRLLLAIVVAAIVALVSTVADRKRPRASWVEPSLHLLLRYSIILGLGSYSWARLVPQQFPPLSYIVAIRLESDSLLMCGRTPPKGQNNLRFSCRDNRHGEFRWTRTGDTLALDGRFDGAAMTASATIVKRSDYRLVGSKPRVIRDR